MDKNHGAHIPSAPLIENEAAASSAKTESERQAEFFSILLVGELGRSAAEPDSRSV